MQRLRPGNLNFLALGLGILAGFLAGCAGGEGGEGSDDRSARGNGTPVLILAIDTLRGDHLHCAGLDWLQTPNIDALARDAVHFKDCLSTAPWTGPAFASIYTGLLPYHHGFLGYVHGRLGDDKVTLAEILRDAGYVNDACVTITYLTGFYGMSQGFGVGEKYDDDGTGESGRLVTAYGQRFLQQRRGAGEPFLLLLHWFDVHAPYTPPAPYDGMYYEGDPRADGEPIVDFLRSDRNHMVQQRDKIYDWLEGVTDHDYAVRQYAAGVSYVDAQIGQVVATLKAEGLYDETCIILLSDHGEHLGEHGLYYTHLYPYQEALHVPLMIKWPGRRYAGRTVEEKVSTLDILPTLLDILALPARAGLDGQSLLPVLNGEKPAEPRLLVAEQGANEQNFVKVLIEGPWKLMMYRVDGEYYPSLYHLPSDPHELKDLKLEHQDVLMRLADKVWEVFDPRQPLTKEEALLPEGVTEETRQRLRSLGYVH